MDTVQGPQYPQLNQQQQSNPLSMYGQLLDMKNAQQAYANSQVQNQILQNQASIGSSQATQQSQQTKEMQALAGTDWTQYTNPDGSLNQAGTKLANQLAPTTGSEFIQHHAVAGKAAVDLADARQDLSQKQLDRISQTFAGVANTPGAKASDFVAAGQKLIDNADDADKPAVQKTIDAATKLATLGVPKDDKGQPVMEGPNGMLARVRMLQRQQAPNGGVQTGALNTGGQVLSTVGDVTGATPTRVNGVIANNTISPENQPGQVNARAAAAQAGSGGAELGLRSYANNLQMKADLPTVQALHDTITAAAKPGGANRFLATHPDVANMLGSMGMDTSATDIGQKAAARLAALSQRGAGTDAARAQIEQGNPNFSKDPRAVTEAADSILSMYKTGAQVSDKLQSRGFHAGNTQGAAEAEAEERAKIGPVGGATSGLPGMPSQYKSLSDLQTAVKSGKLDKQTAITLARKQGFIQ